MIARRRRRRSPDERAEGPCARQNPGRVALCRRGARVGMGASRSNTCLELLNYFDVTSVFSLEHLFSFRTCACASPAARPPRGALVAALVSRIDRLFLFLLRTQGMSARTAAALSEIGMATSLCIPALPRLTHKRCATLYDSRGPSACPLCVTHRAYMPRGVRA